MAIKTGRTAILVGTAWNTIFLKIEQLIDQGSGDL